MPYLTPTHFDAHPDDDGDNAGDVDGDDDDNAGDDESYLSFFYTCTNF